MHANLVHILSVREVHAERVVVHRLELREHDALVVRPANGPVGDAIVGTSTSAPIAVVSSWRPSSLIPKSGESLQSPASDRKRGWFAARPSGTENVYKIYAESFRDGNHLGKIQDDARAAIAKAF